MTDLEASTVGEPPPPYMIFLLVFFFFITGLLGFLVCHLLKKKGYRCRTGDEDEDEEECEVKVGPEKNDYEEEKEENQDTVEQILKCILENEANMEAFKEMLGKHDLCEHHDPRLLRKDSLGGIPPHHHTVHSGAQLDHKSCTLCVQGRSKKARHRSRVPRATKPKAPGERRESTVFAVGRFRVTHMDKKDQGSGEQLDQSEPLDSEKGDEDDPQRKEEYNLRSMFKNVPMENTSSVVPVPKRKKSLVLFSLRRGSDQVGVKVPLNQPVVERRPLFTTPVKAALGQTSRSLEGLSSQINQDVCAPDLTEMAPVKLSPTRVTFLVSPCSPTDPNPYPFNVSPTPVQASPALSNRKTSPSTSIDPSPGSSQLYMCPTPGSNNSGNLNVSPLNLSAPNSVQVSPALSSRKVYPVPTPFTGSPIVPRSILKSTTSLLKGGTTSATPKGSEDKADRVPAGDPNSATTNPVVPPSASPNSRAPPHSKLELPGVTTLTAGPDNRREFSVVCTAEMMQEEDPAVALSPAKEEREDEVEMEDIKDCRVSQEEEGVSLEQKRRSVPSQHKW
ncbi:hypothetical protein UPYG_G00213790 [Umbra pygmaea]|uniref:RELT-like protein 2 n=1 Tax=Umbra pygmaea TaxID=75934 RepID=A0ABD0WLX9_UMBPY